MTVESRRKSPNRTRTASFHVPLTVEERADIDRIVAVAGGSQRDALLRAFGLLASDADPTGVSYRCTCAAELVLSESEVGTLSAFGARCWRCGERMARAGEARAA